MKTVFLQSKKYITVLRILIMVLVLKNNIAAQSLIGSDISYQCTSTSGIYKVAIKIYRNCASIGVCPGCSAPNGTLAGCTTSSSGWTCAITGLSSNCVGVNLGSFALPAVNTQGVYDIVKTCSSISSTCTNCNTRTAGTFNPAMEVYTFEGNVNLNSVPTSCCRVALSASNCCRNVLTTHEPYANFYAFCELDRCQAECNSAPIFTNNAVAAICNGTDFVYNLGAIDPDGDSLSYELGQPYKGIGQPMSYTAPYNVNYPFPYFGAPNANAALPAGLHLNSQTGEIMFRPTGIFTSIFVIKVTQWKLVGNTRVNVGKTRREVQFETIACTENKTPLVKVYKNNVLQLNNIIAYARQQICLNIIAEDLPTANNNNLSADTTDLEWNNVSSIDVNFSNATFTRNYILANRTINGPKADSFKFCWTPATSAIRPIPHYFTVTASDRFCPLIASATKSIGLLVKNPFINIETNTKSVYCKHKSTETNLYFKVNGIDLASNNIFTVQLSDSLGSFLNSTTLKIISSNSSLGYIPISIPQGLALGQAYALRVLCSTDTLCDNTPFPISIVEGFSTPIISSSKTILCKGESTVISALPSNSNLNYIWLRNGLPIPNFNNYSLITDTSGMYKLIIENQGCIDSSSNITITVNQKPIANFSAPDNFCLSNSNKNIEFINNSILDSGTYSSNWFFRDGTSANTLNYNKLITNNLFTDLTAKLVITSDKNCVDSISKTIAIKQQPNSSFTVNNSSQCFKNNAFIFKTDSVLGYNYSWNFGDSILDNKPTANKHYLKFGNYNVKLKVSNGFCSDSSMQLVKIYPSPNVFFTNLTANEQCLKNNNFQFSNNSSIDSGTLVYKWILGENDTISTLNISKIFAKSGFYNINLLGISNFNCVSEFSKQITVNTNPSIGVISGNLSPTSITTPFVYSVSNQPNINYSWFVNNGVIQSGQGTNMVNVIWSSVGNGNLKAKIVNSANCSDSAEITTSITSVGLQDLDLAANLKVYPNPTSSNFTIGNLNRLQYKKYILTNVLGQVVLSGKLNQEETTVNIENLSNGIYLLSIEGIAKQEIKIVKQ